MARKNRIVVNDGIYHLTTRIAHREMLLKVDDLKSKIVNWIYDIAAFSGVELLAWCIMDNHLHILAHMPTVPEEYWLDPNVPPTTATFTIRPSACTPPRWYADGDCPPDWNNALPRPPIGFMLSDEDMIKRLEFLYGSDIAEKKEEAWNAKRLNGRGNEVDEEKERYCRRMYNVSQFAKTLKERIAMRYNADKRNNHAGCLFQGRFHSVVVEKNRESYAAILAYIAANPVKAGIAKTCADWKWSSYGIACRGDSPHAGQCRQVYCKLLGCAEWKEAKAKMEQLLSDRLPDGYDFERDGFTYGTVEINGVERKVPLRVTQVIWLKVRAFTQGSFFSRNLVFAQEALSELPKGFNHAGMWSVEMLNRLNWTNVA